MEGPCLQRQGGVHVNQQILKDVLSQLLTYRLSQVGICRLQDKRWCRVEIGVGKAVRGAKSRIPFALLKVCIQEERFTVRIQISDR